MSLEAIVEALLAEREELRTQRDELLAALRTLVDHAKWEGRVQRWELPGLPAGTLTAARAVIAKAEGKP